MDDQRHPLTRGFTIFSRKQVSFDQFDLRMWMTARDIFDSVKVSRSASEANQIAKTAIKQILDYSRTDEARRSSHEDWIIWRNNKGIDVLGQRTERPLRTSFAADRM
jgi:hypothetical protein